MLLDFSIVVASTTTVALVWRALLVNHPALLSSVEGVPYIGGVLTCGFCSTLWLSLFATISKNPIGQWGSEYPTLVTIFVGWMTVGAGVLFLRNAIAVLMESNALLSHAHHESHSHEEEA